METGRQDAPASRPLVIGHRGASAAAPDNSLAAIDLAREVGADGVEIDVRLTSDRVMVLSHDDAIAGVGPLGSATFSELRASNRDVAALDDVPDVLGDMLLNIEIKNDPADHDFDPSHGQAVAVAQWVERRGLVDRCIISSFNSGSTQAARSAVASISIGLLLADSREFTYHLEAGGAAVYQWLIPAQSALREGGRKKIDMAHRLGVRVGTWTVNDVHSLRRLRSDGIDAVITDDPAGAIATYC